jgi:uncharacterized membrane protein YdjX (TVP38/TMEM64 family)
MSVWVRLSLSNFLPVATMILKSRNTALTILFSLVTIAGSGWLFNQFFSPEQLHGLVDSAGYWGYGLFVVAYVVATLLVLPSTAFNLAGGALFGNFWGLVITSFAAVLSAAIAFYLARKLSQERLAKFFPSSFNRSINSDPENSKSTISFLNRHLRSNGILYIAALRILPLIPFSIVSFTAGVSSIRFRDYFFGTLIGAPLGFAPFILFGNSGMNLAADFQFDFSQSSLSQLSLGQFSLGQFSLGQFSLGLSAIAIPAILILLLLGGRIWYKSRLSS